MEDFDFDSIPDAVSKEATGEDFDFDSIADSPKEFAPMPKDWNKGQYSEVNEKHDRIVAKRMWEVKQTEDDKDAGEIGAFQSAWQKISKGIVGSGIDVVMSEVIDPVVDLGRVISDTFDVGKAAFKIDKATGFMISDSANDLGAAIYENTGALREGAEELGDWWSTLDKNTRKTIESTGLISLIVPNPISNTVKIVSKPVKATSKFIGKKALAKNLSQERHLLQEFVRPPINGKYAAQSQSFTTHGVRGIPAKEAQMASTVSTLKGYKPTASDKFNLSIVNNAKKAQLKAYETVLKTRGKPLNPAQVQNQVDTGMKALADGNPVFITEASGAINYKVPETVAAKVKQIIKNEAVAEGGITPIALHRARIEVDKLIRKGGDAFKINTTNPVGASFQEARTILNKMVDGSIPGLNTNKLRTGVSDLITVSENVGARIIKTQVLTPIEHAYQVLGRYGRMGWAAGAISKTVGAGGRSFRHAEGFSRGVTNAALALGVTYVGGKVIMSRAARKMLVTSLKQLESVAKTTTKAADLLEIKSAKAGLVRLLASGSVVEGSK